MAAATTALSAGDTHYLGTVSGFIASAWIFLNFAAGRELLYLEGER